MEANDSQDDSSAVTPQLGRAIEQPVDEINEFLDKEPSICAVYNLHAQYEAYVYELERKLGEDDSTEDQDIDPAHSEAAYQRFCSFNPDDPDLGSVLYAYREALERLERTVRRMSHETLVTLPNDKAKRRRVEGTEEGLSVSQIVSSGFGILFGRQPAEVSNTAFSSYSSHLIEVALSSYIVSLCRAATPH